MTSSIDLAQAREDVAILNLRYIEAVDACGANPEACELSSIPVAPGSPMASRLSEIVDSFRAKGWYLIPGGSLSYAIVSGDAALNDSGAGLAVSIDVCAVDAAVTMDSRGTSDVSDDAVVSDTVTSTWSRRTYERSGSQWLISTIVVGDKVEGDTCGR